MDYPKSVANVGLVDGKFVDENTATGVVGSLIPSDWGNAVTDELLGVIKAAGLTPSESDLTQLAKAIRTISVTVVGSIRNGRMAIPAASATATFSADEIVVESALGGQAFKLSSFSKTINVAASGAGGMDTGAAPASGFVAIYAIYNPTTKTAALLGVNATTAIAPEVYGGTSMPSGYTASALVSIWPTNASGLLKVGKQKDRAVCAPTVVAFTSTANQATFTSVSIASVVPMNARTVSGYLQASSTSTSNAYFNVASDVAGSGLQGINGYLVSTSSLLGGFSNVMIDSQTLYYQNNVTAGTPTYQLAVDAYTF